jgi:CHAT domain-containing protein
MTRTLTLTGRSGQVLLIPAGTLGILPLHAAWRPDARAPTGRKYACDRVVISYAPNARSVASPPGEGAGTLLAVADPAPLPEPLRPLTFAEPEVAAAAAWYPEATVLRREQATAERVLRGLAAASVHHLACHGRVDLSEPRRSALVLSGGQPLTLQQLLDLRLDGRAGQRLAVLTACETALAGSTLPDEVVSLPGALLQAGFTGVVATQWAVTGLPAAFLTARFYQHWKQDKWDWATSLAAAQRWLRDSTDGEKAAFVHPREGSPLLPVTARRPLWRAVVGRDPAGRSFADVADWGAYTYVGATITPLGADDTRP